MAALANSIMADSLVQVTTATLVSTWVSTVTKRLTITTTNALINPTIVAPETAYTIEDQ